MTDPLVIFTPSGKRGHVAPGTTVLAAARQLGVDLDSVCGGRGICSKCQVEPAFGAFPKHGVTVTEEALSPRNAVEDRYDRIRGLAPARRLGCQALILADAVLDVPPESQVHKQVVRKRAEARPVVMDPATRLHYVEVAPPDMHEPSGDLQRLERALAEQWGIPNAKGDLRTLQMAQPALRKGDWKVTCAVYGDGPEPRILQVWPGFYGGPIYGLAIDVGSTTIAGHLCDLATGDVIASTGLMNPQIRFGEDLRLAAEPAPRREAADPVVAVLDRVARGERVLGDGEAMLGEGAEGRLDLALGADAAAAADRVEVDAEGAGGRQHGGAGRDVAALAGWREDHERVGHAAGFLGARRPS